MTQKLREILQSVLLNIKADGLCNLDESCGCGLDDLAPCGNCNLDECEPAKWIKPEDGNPMVLEEFPEGYYSPLKKQAARIQELESSLDEAEALTKKNAELMNGYLGRIAELEDTLVEERTGAIRCESYDHCEGMYRIDLPDAMIRAQQELQAEGKIGPDAETGNRDHVVGPDQMIPNGKVWPIAEELRHCTSCGKSIEEIKGNLCKGDYFIGSIFIDPGQEGSRYDPPIEASYYFSCCDCSQSWQITEERKDALGVILARIEYDQSQPGRFNYTISRAKDTLRAMLEEAE